jgi:indole-3-glycerol phosphate synthase
MASTPSELALEPLAAARVEAIPGVLGTIARERARDYADAPTRFPVTTPVPAGRFREALGRARAPGRPALVAEVKRASPSQGVIADVDPIAMARAYVAGGAAAVSVLTEERHFGGKLEHLRAVSAAVAAPTLRKDFVVHPWQLVEAQGAGAAAVLLIAAVLGDALPDYLAAARALGLDALVEVHDEAELALALSAGSEVVGVNNRDLRTLAIDLGTAPRLIAAGRAAREGLLWIAESGYATAADVASVAPLADALLVGTSLVRHGDVAAGIRSLMGDGS